MQDQLGKNLVGTPCQQTKPGMAIQHFNPTYAGAISRRIIFLGWAKKDHIWKGTKTESAGVHGSNDRVPT
jgi:hypothetical protein